MRFEVDTWKYGIKPLETAKIAQGSPRARWPFQKVGIFQKFVTLLFDVWCAIITANEKKKPIFNGWI